MLNLVLLCKLNAAYIFQVSILVFSALDLCFGRATGYFGINGNNKCKKLIPTSNPIWLNKPACSFYHH